MASQWKLIIDTVLLDSHEGGASTIDGTFIGFGDRESGTIIEETAESLRFPFRVHVSAPDSQTLSDRTQDVLDALELAASKGFTLEDEADVEHISIDPANYQSIDFEVVTLLGPDGARSGNILECAFTVTKLDSDYTSGKTSWSYQRNSSGRAFCIGRVFAETRAAALAIVAPMRSGATRPVWMPSSLRVVEDTNEFDAVPGNPTALLDGSFRPAEAVVVFEQMPGWASGDSRFADVKRLECRFEARPRANMSTRAGNLPGLDVSIAATMHFKTENSTTYEAADTSVVASNALSGKVIACAQAVIDEAKRRLGEAELNILTPLEKVITGEDGVYSFTVQGVTGGASRVLAWEETDVYEETSQNEDLPIFGGGEWVFEKLPLCTIRHTLNIVSLGSGRSYIKPVSINRRPGNGTWEQRYLGDQPVEIMPNDGEAVTQYVARYQRHYKFIRKGSGGGNGDRYAPQRGQGPQGHAG